MYSQAPSGSPYPGATPFDNPHAAQGYPSQPQGYPNQPYGQAGQPYPNQPANPAYSQPNQQPGFYPDQKQDPAADAYDPYNTDSLSVKLSESTRLGFIRKVMCILACQLTFTAVGVVYSVAFADSLLHFLSRNIYLLWVAIGVQLVCLFTLCCVRSIARSVPTNYILLSLFTVAMTVIVMAITSQYNGETVLIAAVLTAMATLGLMFYAMTTKTDFTLCGGIIWALVMISITCIILSIFIRNRTFQIFLSGLAIIIVSFYIIFDTQLIIGNQENKLQIDDYIFAAMMLYLDIIRLFLEILKILGKK